jgi:tetratricopeptide (TPR) repeat protein
MNLSRPFACVILLYASSSAAEETPPAREAAPSRPDAGAEARQDYERGQTHYDLGDYPAAIALFRTAYELSSAPALLFNIAQAYRLSGDCAKALAEYRHFVRLDPQSSRRADADAYIVSLGAECGAKQPVPVAAPATAAPVLESGVAAPRPPQGDRSDVQGSKMAVSTKLGWALLGSGLALGIGAGSLTLWNDGRYGTWTREDRALSSPPPADPAQRATWVARQNANDNLLSSVHGVDRAAVVMAGTSAACIIAAAVIALVKHERPPEIALEAHGMRLSWSLEP